MKTLARLLIVATLAAGTASATVPTYFTPADVLARLSQFDGRQIAVGGRLRLERGARCLFLGEGIWAGRFAIAPQDAARIRADQAHLAGRFVIVEGILRVRRSGDSGAGPAACGDASIEGPTMREAIP